MSNRPSSPKSDTEYELDKSSSQSSRKSRLSFGWHWTWGHLPEQRPSVLRYLWPSSSKKSTPKEGVYLEDITNNKCDDRSRYLPQMYVIHINYYFKIKRFNSVRDYNQSSPRLTKDEDQESGTGNSIPNSPVRDFEASYV